MKKLITIIVLFTLYNSAIAKGYRAPKKTAVFREMICQLFSKYGLDPAPMCNWFDATNAAYKVKKIVFVKNGTHSSHFFPNGTMLLSGESMEEYFYNYVGELAHAVQFSEDFMYFGKMALKEIFATYVRSVFSRKKLRHEVQELQRKSVERGVRCPRWKAYFWVAYREWYKKPNSFEEIAHKHYEPMLWLSIVNVYSADQQTKLSLLFTSLARGKFCFLRYTNDMKKMSFADRVRAVVMKIPKGKTLSYSAVAAFAGSPRAARAVGTIMANNRDPHIPCHRVIRSDGALGDYNRGGTKQKRALLVKEGAIL